jgi:hypothetical protein
MVPVYGLAPLKKDRMAPRKTQTHRAFPLRLVGRLHDKNSGSSIEKWTSKYLPTPKSGAQESCDRPPRYFFSLARNNRRLLNFLVIAVKNEYF